FNTSLARFLRIFSAFWISHALTKLSLFPACMSMKFLKRMALLPAICSWYSQVIPFLSSVMLLLDARAAAQGSARKADIKEDINKKAVREKIYALKAFNSYLL